MTALNILSGLLIVITFISYLPQYHRLLTSGSTTGLSFGSVFSLTMVAQIQSVSMYYLFRLSPSMRYGTPIATPPCTRDWLNLLQILVQWICSLTLFTLVIFLPPSIDGSTSKVIPKTISVLLWILHAVLFRISLETEADARDIVWTITTNINARIVNTLFTLIIVIAFFLQVKYIPSEGQSSALSKWTIGLQSITFLLLAISWPFRLILPPNMWELGDKPAILLEWYPWVGWACVNSAIMAVGQGISLFLYIRGMQTGSTTMRLVNERNALLRAEEYERGNWTVSACM